MRCATAFASGEWAEQATPPPSPVRASSMASIGEQCTQWSMFTGTHHKSAQHSGSVVARQRCESTIGMPNAESHASVYGHIASIGLRARRARRDIGSHSDQCRAFAVSARPSASRTLPFASGNTDYSRWVVPRLQ